MYTDMIHSCTEYYFKYLCKIFKEYSLGLERIGIFRVKIKNGNNS